MSKIFGLATDKKEFLNENKDIQVCGFFTGEGPEIYFRADGICAKKYNEAIEVERNKRRAIYQLFCSVNPGFAALQNEVDERLAAMRTSYTESQKEEYDALRKELHQCREEQRRYTKDNKLYARYRDDIRVLSEAASDKVRTIFGADCQCDGGLYSETRTIYHEAYIAATKKGWPHLLAADDSQRIAVRFQRATLSDGSMRPAPQFSDIIDAPNSKAWITSHNYEAEPASHRTPRDPHSKRVWIIIQALGMFAIIQEL